MEHYKNNISLILKALSLTTDSDNRLDKNNPIDSSSQSIVTIAEIQKQHFAKIKLQAFEGLIEILPNHQQYVATLDPGIITAINNSNQEIKIELISKGVIKFADNVCEVIAAEIKIA